jgi:hypothetical protein
MAHLQQTTVHRPSSDSCTLKAVSPCQSDHEPTDVFGVQLRSQRTAYPSCNATAPDRPASVERVKDQIARLAASLDAPPGNLSWERRKVCFAVRLWSQVPDVAEVAATFAPNAAPFVLFQNRCEGGHRPWLLCFPARVAQTATVPSPPLEAAHENAKAFHDKCENG